MSRAFRNSATGRHPALNRVPRDFLSKEGANRHAPFNPTRQE
ncbi:hypothetical protein [Salibaculum sp.]|nr:hypothetical protein [Salibaculum sp.]HKL69768.1 hypothetical protein [Salibaculum sp.]